MTATLQKQAVLAAAMLVSLQHESEADQVDEPERRELMLGLAALVEAYGRDAVEKDQRLKVWSAAQCAARGIREFDVMGRQSVVMTLVCRAAYRLNRGESRAAAQDLATVTAYTELVVGERLYMAEMPVGSVTERERMLCRLLAVVGEEIVSGKVASTQELEELRRFYHDQVRLAESPSQGTEKNMVLLQGVMGSSDADLLTVTLHVLAALVVRYHSIHPTWTTDTMFEALLAKRLKRVQA